MRVASLASALAVLAALPAAAQQPPAQQPVEIPPQIVALKAYVNAPDYVATTARMVLEGDKDLAPDCTKAVGVGRVGFVVMQMPEFKEGNPHPVAGQWKDQIKIDRCGTPIVHNVLVTARADGLPTIGLALPGETALSPRLQREAIADVLKAAGSRLKCKDLSKGVVSDTKMDAVLVQPKAKGGVVVEGKWQETWTARLCNKTTAVKLEMTADGKGSATHKVVK